MQDLVVTTFLDYAADALGLEVSDDLSWLPPNTPRITALLRAADLAAAAAGRERAQVLHGFGHWLDSRLVRDSALSKARLLSSLLALRQEMERWLCRRHAFANLGPRTPADSLNLVYRDGTALGDVLQGLLEARLRREGAAVRVRRQELHGMAGAQIHFHLERQDATA